MLYQNFGYDPTYEFVKLHQQQLLRAIARERLAVLVCSSWPSRWRVVGAKVLQQLLEWWRAAGRYVHSRPSTR